LNATAGLGRIVGEYPSIAVEIVDDVATLFDADNPKLRNNAIGLIGDVAIVHTDVVEPYTEEITALLTVEDTYTRINASGALSRVAEDFRIRSNTSRRRSWSCCRTRIRSSVRTLAGRSGTSVLETPPRLWKTEHTMMTMPMSARGHRGRSPRSTNEAGLDIPLADSVRRVRECRIIREGGHRDSMTIERNAEGVSSGWPVVTH